MKKLRAERRERRRRRRRQMRVVGARVRALGRLLSKKGVSDA
jgi:hypothetical protein